MDRSAPLGEGVIRRVRFALENGEPGGIERANGGVLSPAIRSLPSGPLSGHGNDNTVPFATLEPLNTV